MTSRRRLATHSGSPRKAGRGQMSYFGLGVTARRRPDDGSGEWCDLWQQSQGGPLPVN